MSHEDYENLAPIYALGALDGEDLPRFRSHLGGCTDCQTVVRECENVGTEIAMGLAPSAPPAALKERILKEVRSPARGGQVLEAPFGIARVLAIAAVVAVAVMGYFLRDAYQKLSDNESAKAQLHKDKEQLDADKRKVAADLEKSKKEYAKSQDALKDVSEKLVQKTDDATKLEAEKKRLEGEIAKTATDIARLKKMDALIRDIKAQVLAFKGTPLAKDATGRVFWKDEEVVFIADLPPLPAGKVYELWALVDGAPGPVPAGIYDAAGNKTADFWKLQKGAKIKGWAISREDAAVEKPTEVLLLAQ